MLKLPTTSCFVRSQTPRFENPMYHFVCFKVFWTWVFRMLTQKEDGKGKRCWRNEELVALGDTGKSALQSSSAVLGRKSYSAQLLTQAPWWVFLFLSCLLQRDTGLHPAPWSVQTWKRGLGNTACSGLIYSGFNQSKRICELILMKKRVLFIQEHAACFIMKLHKNISWGMCPRVEEERQHQLEGVPYNP